MNGFQNIITNAWHLSIARIINVLLRIIYIIFIARLLGPELYGLFAYAQSWYLTFLSLTTFGLGYVLSNVIGRQSSEINSFLMNSLFIKTASVIVAAFFSGLTGVLFHQEYFTRLLFGIFSLALIGRGIALWSQMVFTAFEQSRRTFLQELLFRPLEVMVGLVFILKGGGVLGLGIIHCLNWWLQALAGLRTIHRLTELRFHLFNLQEIKTILAWGVPLGLAALAAAWLTQGPIILSRQSLHFHPEQIGQLALAMQGLSVAIILPTSIGKAALPVLSRTVARGDEKDIIFANVLSRAGWLFGSIAGFFGLTYGVWFITTLLGQDYEQAGQLLGLTPWLITPLTIGTACHQVLAARGLRALPLMGALAGLSFFIGLFIPCMQFFGLYGPVVAACLGLTIWAIWMAFSLFKLIGLDLSECLFRPGITCTCSLIAFLFLKNQTPAGALIASTTIMIAGFLVFRLHKI